MFKNNMINLFKSFKNTNKFFMNQYQAITNETKNPLSFSCLNKINKFTFTEKSTMELIKILRAETSNKTI